VLAAVLGVVVLLLAGMGVLWAITPSVGDAEARIAARLAAHGRPTRMRCRCPTRAVWP